MKRLFLIATLLVCAASHLAAQEPTPVVPLHHAPNADEERMPSMADLTPEMQFYLQQLQRHEDPKMAVRRKAEQRAMQRSNRIAARKWFGLSNSRPGASPIPVMGTYSPFWAGNDRDPNRWNGVGPAVIQVRRTHIDLR